jgi:hypothetical protein
MVEPSCPAANKAQPGKLELFANLLVCDGQWMGFRVYVSVH